ncbi:MAG: hypothetical protein NTZ80_00880 [Patescibacteria group bacterium]|nr:hypothetical protein [Patescibacteria group bacterium]
MKFQYFTYFLDPLSQQSLFPDTRDKNEIFQKIMSKKMEYQNGTSNLVYVCHNNSEGLLHGKLGKRSSIRRNFPSDNDFIEELETDYPNCNILFNFSNNPETGQKIAFEYNSSVFRFPEKQLKALEKNINTQLFISGYALSIHPVVDQKEFWELIHQHQGRIEKLTFSYAVPNLFNLETALSEDLKSSGKKYGITNASIELENKGGQLLVPSDDPFINQSAEYTGKGGGEYRLKVKGIKTVISSGKNVKTKTFEGIELATNDMESFKEIAKNIFS